MSGFDVNVLSTKPVIREAASMGKMTAGQVTWDICSKVKANKKRKNVILMKVFFQRKKKIFLSQKKI